MSDATTNEKTRFLEEQIGLEEKKYITAFKSDAEFHVLKSIRQRISQLKAELCDLRVANGGNAEDDIFTG